MTVQPLSYKPLRFSSENKSESLSRGDRFLSTLIAASQLVPSIDETFFQYNLPRKRMNECYKPHRDWAKTPDGKLIRTYFFPAIDATANRLMANKDHHTGLGSKETLVMAHGYKSSVTSQLTVNNIARLLGLNVLTYDARGHGDSSGFRRGGYTTAIGFDAPLDLGTVVANFKEKHPDQRVGGLGYSMGASGIMFYPETLSPKHLPDSKDRVKKEKKLAELKQTLETFPYVILDSPYDTFDLMTNPVMMKKVNAFADSWPAIKLFGSSDKARERIIHILRHFNEEGSKKFLGIPLPFKDYKPIETYAGSKLAEEVPTLHLHGIHDEDTLPIAQENIRKAGIIKQGKFVPLDAEHSAQTLIDPKNPTSAKRYFQMLRDPGRYIKELTGFLGQNNAFDSGLLDKEAVKEKLENPNQATLKAKD